MIGTAIAWITGSRIGRIVAAALAVLAFIKFVDLRGRHIGRAEAKDYIAKKSNEAAARRREERDEVDHEVRSPGAADRLRDHWRRPED